jgi:putative SOS response-associated peptidase YedK
MCERITVPDHAVAEREFLPARSSWTFSARFNVAGSQSVPAIRQHAGQSEGVTVRWGLIPSRTLEPSDAQGVLSVELDQIERGDTFRVAWRQSQRCIVPVSGFYVWQLTSDRYRQPFFIRVMDRPVFGLAAIWDRSVGAGDEVVESCCLISVPANELMVDIANTERRMPAILRRKDYERWLQGTPEAAKRALQPYDARSLQAYPVSPRINSLAHDDFGLIQPAQLDPLRA